MSDAKRQCDLCGLDVADERNVIRLASRTLYFCCEGCRGIYCMLNGPGEDQGGNDGRQTHDARDEHGINN